MPADIQALITELSGVIEGQKGTDQIRVYLRNIQANQASARPDVSTLQTLIRMGRLRQHSRRVKERVKANYNEAVEVSGVHLSRL